MSLSNAASTVMNSEVQNLIERKLRHLKNAQQEICFAEKTKTLKQMHEEIQSKYPLRNSGFDVASLPERYYKKIASANLAVTQSWPNAAWLAIKSILDKTHITPQHKAMVFQCLDAATWMVSECQPFTLTYLEPKHFSDAVMSTIKSFGGINDLHWQRFTKSLELHSGLAFCGIKNEGRKARVAVDLEVEEYFLSSLDMHKNASYAPVSQKHYADTAQSTCYSVPNPPKKVNDWFLAIDEMASHFKKKNGRLPNSTEAWLALKTNPPSAYGIQLSKRHEKETLLLGEKHLNKEAFEARWTTYNKQNKSGLGRKS